MARTEWNGTSRSLAIYGLLLGLYPRPYLQRHRAEMLQNFQDLEQASPSKSALWLLIERDLLDKLRSKNGVGDFRRRASASHHAQRLDFTSSNAAPSERENRSEDRTMASPLSRCVLHTRSAGSVFNDHGQNKTAGRVARRLDL